YLSAELAQRVANDVRTLCAALGYDINTVEFAIKGDVPYAIDFMNPAPDAELASVGPFYHNWLTRAVTDLVFRRLSEPQAAPTYRWDALLSPASASAVAAPLAAAASAAGASVDAVFPQSVRELPSEVASTVTELVGQATGIVSGIVETVTDAVSGAPEEKKTVRRTRAAPASKKAPAKKGSATRTKKTPTPPEV
ncbi:MAG TPA: hypothetical protein VD968_06640, partial [Pyrinomonadaceae bacterium]|nr:hypothetical protein [Pyrinomonadaceae bacterium]